MLEKIHDEGGADAVIQFREVWQEGRRVFSVPWNSQHMGDYACDVGEKGRVVLVDVYSDGTTLSNSGTQSVNNMRVRFSNIRGITSQWFEVGIVPTLNLDDLKVSGAAARREKNELWQRFTFMAFKTCIEKSHAGVVVGGIKLFPKFGAIVTDQVQERPTCRLKGHDSFFDRTHCLFPTRTRKASATAGNAESSSRERTKPDSATSQRSSVSTDDRHDAIVSGVTNNLTSNVANGEVHLWDVQRSAMRHPKRGVWWAIRRQVAVAEHRIRKKSTSSSWVRIKEYRMDLEGVSALDFPPALAAFAGARTFTYMFFGCVAYDKLHVNEHGVFKQIADEIF